MKKTSTFIDTMQIPDKYKDALIGYLQLANGDLARETGLMCRLMVEFHMHSVARRFKPTPKQLQYYALGEEFSRRAIFAGNRFGKTTGGAFEVRCHLTGEYPDWWKGKRFDRPVKVWACSTTKEKTIAGVQEMLLGRFGHFGTGFIEKHRILATERMQNVAGGINRAKIKYRDHFQRNSVVVFKSYEQGRTAFETEKVDVVWLDEEPPYDIFRECQMRILGTNDNPGGQIMLTFTPLKGMSEVCRVFLKPEQYETDSSLDLRNVKSRAAWITASWEDNPHLREDEIRELVKTTPKHELEARRDGRPSLGTGAIYPIPDSYYQVKPFSNGIPHGWHWGIGIDHGFEHPTAIVVGVKDPATGIVYIIACWKRSQETIGNIASVLRTFHGEEIPVFGDPSGEAERQEAGGRSIHEQYLDENISIAKADNQVESGTTEVRTGLQNGRLKILETCVELIDEIRLYRKNDKGKVVKEFDDLVDALRYLYRHRDEMEPLPGERSKRFEFAEGESWKA